MNEITIASTNVTVKEYQGQRVITFKDIDTVHQRPDGTDEETLTLTKSTLLRAKITSYEIRTKPKTSLIWLLQMV